jgi:hypothetical protein
MTTLITVILAMATTLFAFAIAIAKGELLKSSPSWLWPTLLVISGILYVTAFVLGVIHWRREKKDKIRDQQNAEPKQELLPSPMLEVIEDKNILIAYNGREWHEEDPGTPHLISSNLNAHIIVFRKKLALPGESSSPLSRVSAHLTFRGKDDSQLVINFGTWLREYTHYVNFVRAETHALVLSSGVKADGKIDECRVYAFDNPHHTDPRHAKHHSGIIVVRAPTEKPLMDNCSEVEIVLIADQTTVYHGTFTFILDPDGTMRNFNLAN